MAVFPKQNPIGLDAIIAQVQTALMQLETTWGVEIDGYPRCYPLERDGKKGIEHYITNREYSKSLIVGERNKFFFTAERKEERFNDTDFIHYKAEVELFFILNLTDCYPFLTHRADGEVRTDVTKILERKSGVKVKEIHKEIDDVFNGYAFDYAHYMQPYCVFRITFDALGYKIDETNCT